MSAPGVAADAGYYDGLNVKLLAAVPSGARRVLELGCANGRLGRRFKARHPGVHWCGVDVSAQAVATAAPHLDRAVQIDLDRGDLAALGSGYDVVVIGDLLEHLCEPDRLLEALYDCTSADARIVCCLPNMAHWSVIQRLLVGDASYDAVGLLDRTHVRFYSPASAFKTFLDAGWLPHLQDQYRVETVPNAFASLVVEAAQALGVPAATAKRTLGLYQMIVSCTKWSLQELLAPGPRAPLSVIVPVDRPWQYELNVARSPGLQEVHAEVITVQGADSAAAAYAAGAARASHAWRLLVHQDVYFPVGSGHALAQRLGALEAAGLTLAPVGFAGLEEDPAHPDGVRMAGLVVDRQNLFRHPPGGAAISIDEFAVALHRDSALAPDPALGWHLWATDLCLQARQRAGCAATPVLEVPLFHNSTSDYTLPDAFHASADRLLAKYPQLERIPTLCGCIERPKALVTA